MAEADAVMVLHELDRVARFVTHPATPPPLGGRHDEFGCLLVVVERAEALPVFAAVLAQFDAPAAHQGEEIGFPFDPLDFRFRDAWHGQFSSVTGRRFLFAGAPTCRSSGSVRAASCGLHSRWPPGRFPPP